MVSEELMQSLDTYLLANYIRETDTSKRHPAGDMDRKGSREDVIKAGDGVLTERESIKLQQLMETVGESFHDMLFRLIDQRGMADTEVYKRAHIDRRLFFKIKSNPAYHMRKQTVLALAIGLELNIGETVELLARAEYALSPGNKGDLIVQFFIEQGIYDIMMINEVLNEYGQKLLE